MLILAGVSINAIVGDNGILTKTQEAATKYKISEIKEKLEMFKLNNQMESPNKDIKDFFIEEGLVTESELNEKSIITIYNNIILVSKYEGLIEISQKVENGEDYMGKEIFLVNDIDAGASFDLETGELLSGENFKPIGYSNCKIEDEGLEGSIEKKFNGTFDGGNHKITNLYIKKNAETDFCTALFGYVGESGIIENLTISDSYIRGYYEVGSIAGRSRGKIINCINESKVVGDDHLTGGIVGRTTGIIEDCVNKGIIQGNGKQTGGIVANCDFGNVVIKDCINYGRIDANAITIGGIAGGAYSGNKEEYSLIIQNCKNYGIVGNYEINSIDTGGIVGIIQSIEAEKSEIINCINDGEIRGYKNIGGIAGRNIVSQITNCKNNGNINLEYELGGGIVGFNNGGIISKCINYGTMNFKETGRYGITGIAGRSNHGSVVSKIELCCNFGNINVSAGGQVAGIVGNADSGNNIKNIVENCYNSVTITCNTNTIGGIAGFVQGVELKNCYNIGNIISTSTTGGIIGSASGSTNIYANNYWLDDCGATRGVGNLASSDGIESKSMSLMKNIDNILGTEFCSDTKNINKGFPILKWQN